MIIFIQDESKPFPVWLGRSNDLIIQINHITVMDVYGFIVFKDSQKIYDSIDKKIIFTEYDETVQYIEKWVKKYETTGSKGL